MAAPENNVYTLTPHAAMRAIERHVSLAEIMRCILHGQRKLHIMRGAIEYVMNGKNHSGKVFVIVSVPQRNVITVYRTHRKTYRKT